MKILLKTTFFFCFIFLTIAVNGQHRDTEGRKEADEDWTRGEAKYYIFGLRSGKIKDFEDGLYLEHLDVSLTHKGCLVTGTEWGYNMRIKEILKEKLQAQYGRDKIISLTKHVHIFYDSLNKLKTRKAICKEGEKRLLAWFNTVAQYLQDDKKYSDLGKHLQITLTFTVNKKGKCKNFSLTKTESPEFNDRLFKTYKTFFEHSRWLPAKENGVRIPEEKTFDIVFNPD